MQLDKALLFLAEVAKKALFMASDLCLFVDGIARPGMNLADFATDPSPSSCTAQPGGRR